MNRVVGFFFTFFDGLDGDCPFEDDWTEDDLEGVTGDKGVEGRGDGKEDDRGLGMLGESNIGEDDWEVDGIGEVAGVDCDIDEGNDGEEQLLSGADSMREAMLSKRWTRESIWRDRFKFFCSRELICSLWE